MESLQRPKAKEKPRKVEGNFQQNRSALDFDADNLIEQKKEEMKKFEDIAGFVIKPKEYTEDVIAEPEKGLFTWHHIFPKSYLWDKAEVHHPHIVRLGPIPPKRYNDPSNKYTDPNYDSVTEGALTPRSKKIHEIFKHIEKKDTEKKDTENQPKISASFDFPPQKIKLKDKSDEQLKLADLDQWFVVKKKLDTKLISAPNGEAIKNKLEESTVNVHYIDYEVEEFKYILGYPLKALHRNNFKDLVPGTKNNLFYTLNDILKGDDRFYVRGYTDKDPASIAHTQKERELQEHEHTEINQAIDKSVDLTGFINEHREDSVRYGELVQLGMNLHDILKKIKQISGASDVDAHLIKGLHYDFVDLGDNKDLAGKLQEAVENVNTILEKIPPLYRDGLVVKPIQAKFVKLENFQGSIKSTEPEEEEKSEYIDNIDDATKVLENKGYILKTKNIYLPEIVNTIRDKNHIKPGKPITGTHLKQYNTSANTLYKEFEDNPDQDRDSVIIKYAKHILKDESDMKKNKNKAIEKIKDLIAEVTFHANQIIKFQEKADPDKIKESEGLSNSAFLEKYLKRGYNDQYDNGIYNDIKKQLAGLRLAKPNSGEGLEGVVADYEKERKKTIASFEGSMVEIVKRYTNLT